MPLGADVRTHAAQLVDVAEAAGEEVLGDDPDAVRDTQHGDEERLVVGRDPRVRQRRDVDALERPSDDAQSPSGRWVISTPISPELAEEHRHVVDPGVLDDDLAAGDRGRGQERRGDDPVGDDVMAGGLELLDPLDHDPRGPGAGDPRSHRPEEHARDPRPPARGQRSR